MEEPLPDVSVGYDPSSKHELSARVEFRDMSFLLAKTKHDTYVNSGPVMSEGGSSFCIYLYPNGRGESYSMGLFLILCRKDESRSAQEVFATWSMNVVDAAGKVVWSYSKNEPKHFRLNQGWGPKGVEATSITQYGSESELEAAYSARMKAFKHQRFFVGDALNIHACVKFCIGSPQRLKSVAACTHNGVGELASDIGRLLEDAATADVKLVCKDGALPAHRLVLMARSPVFRAMFQTSMRECASGEISLNDIARTTAQHFLHYMYHGSSPDGLPDAELWALLPVAHRYGVKSLVAECSATLAAKLDAQNAAAVFAEADLLDIDSLKNAALDFMLRDSATFERVQASAAYTALPARLLQDVVARSMGSKKRGRPEQASELADGTPWETLPVVRLKQALAERGLSTAGLKAQLVERLNQAEAGSGILP
uniref:SAP domain-containing protein n=1 Tax=Zooxanthella nutricula TaxID=1333877 RepID=A0A6U9P4E8_9DINO|mmetsp:Transcript_88062/g.269442  ORF Transcript_88062/g.269442 Transcript_88062/m.269442 type:complete len:427 (+) Transcript_88062:79-1359(+)